MAFSIGQPKHLYLFHHVGKCAGTSLVQAFGCTGRQGICLGFQCKTRAEVRRSARRQLVQHRISPSRLKVFFGHRVYYGLHQLCPQPSRYFTFLREPIERVISLYNYHCDIALNPSHQHFERDRLRLLRNDRLISFNEWFDTQYTGNHLIRFLYFAMEGELVHVPEPMTEMHLAAAKRFLDLCWFIGFTETSEQDIPLVCQAVGVAAPKQRANVSRQHLDDSERKRVAKYLEEKDVLDMRLFEYAKQLRQA